MTQHEFESRTMVKVSSFEFEAINTVYMASDYSDEIAKTHRNPDVTPRYVNTFFNNIFTIRYYELGSSED